MDKKGQSKKQDGVPGNTKTRNKSITKPSTTNKPNPSKNTANASDSDCNNSCIICSGCETAFTQGDDKLIECERCESWFCLKCSGLSAVEYDVLSQENSRMHWFCRECNGAALTAVKSDNLIEEKCKQYFDTFKSEIEQHVKEQIDELRDELSVYRNEQSKINCETSEKIANLATDSIAEIRDRESRKQNVIFFNVPESDHEDPEERRIYDQAQVHHVCSNVLEVDCELSNVIRLGKKTDSSRPLRATTTNLKQTQDILRASRKLAEHSSEEVNKISLKRDMTPLEREEMRKLVKIRNLKRQSAEAAGESSLQWVIRKGRVISTARPPRARALAEANQ